MADPGPLDDTPVFPTRASRRVLGGFIALSLTSFGVMLLQMGYAAATSRMLPAGAFGAYAVALTGVGLLSLMNGSTMGQAAARSSRPIRSVDRALVTLSFITGAVVAALAVVVAPAWSALWGIPGATPITITLAMGTPFVSLAAVLAGILRRHGRTTVVARRTASAQVLGMAIGLAVVARTQAAWSLAISAVAAAVLTAFLLAAALPRAEIRPGAPTRDILEDAVYSLKAAGVNVLRYATNLLTPWSVGRFAGADDLGAYNRATTLVSIPLQNVQNAFAYSLFPELRPNGPVFSQQRVFTQIVVLVTWPAAILLGLGVVAAGPFLSLLLGPSWAAAAALGGLAVCLGVVPMFEVPVLSAVEALGKFGIATRAWAISSLAIVVGAAFTWATHDPRYAMIGLIGAKVGSVLIAGAYLARNGLFDVRVYTRDVAPVVVLQGFVAVVVGIAMAIAPDSDGVRLGIVGAVGAVEVLALYAARRRTSFGRIARAHGLPGFSA